MLPVIHPSILHDQAVFAGYALPMLDHAWATMLPRIGIHLGCYGHLDPLPDPWVYLATIAREWDRARGRSA